MQPLFIGIAEFFVGMRPFIIINVSFWSHGWLLVAWSDDLSIAEDITIVFWLEEWVMLVVSFSMVTAMSLHFELKEWS